MVRDKLPVASDGPTEGMARISPQSLSDGWALLEALPFPVLQIREDCTVARANRASEVIYGSREGKCFELSHARSRPCDEAGESCPKARALAEGTEVVARHVHATPQGVRVFLVSAYPLSEGGILEFHMPIEESLGRDRLTGLYNRDFFDQLVARQLALLERMNLRYAVIMLDIDFFKKVNDTHGHALGDVVLREIGDVLIRNCREGDSVGRYGGEEFCIFMPGADVSGAKSHVERLQQELQKLSVSTEGEPVRPTASFGIWSGEARVDMAKALQEADKALYRAKESGRNRCCVAASE